MDKNTKISEHFNYGQVIYSKTAILHGMSNTVPEKILPKIILVAENILEPTYNHFKKTLLPSSWWRCAALNTLISRKSNSQHILGEAVDFTVQGISNLEAAIWIKDHLEYDQLILEYYNPKNPFAGWIHCSYVADRKNRKETLRTTDGITYLPGLSHA